MTGTRKRHPKTAFWTVKAIAEYLGVSPRSVLRWVRDGDLVSHKFGRSTRISDADFAEFIRRCREAD